MERSLGRGWLWRWLLAPTGATEVEGSLALDNKKKEESPDGTHPGSATLSPDPHHEVADD